MLAQTPELDAKKKDIDRLVQEMGVAGSPEEYDALKKKYDTAVDDYRKLRARHQSENDQDVACKTALNSSIASYKDRDYTAARTHAMNAQKTCPDNAQAAYMLGLAERKLGNYQAALAALGKATQLDPEDTKAILEKARMLAGEMKRPREAADVLDAMIAQHPTEARPWFEKGKIFLEQRNFEMAIPALEQAVVVDPSFTRGWVTLTQACVEAHDCEKAIKAAANALKDKGNRDIAEVYYHQATAYNQCSQFDKAIEAADACLENVSKLKQNKSFIQGGAHYEKGVALMKRGMLDTAKKSFQDASAFIEWRQSANFELDAIKKDQG
ncbi:MAG: tetratricopeptide repeat protein [bacterium]|nr:tetratricopeptide repeat protein [bacterium]